MDTLTQDVLKTLTETEGEWCVSIFMPTVRAGSESQQNPIRFKNLLRSAEEELKAVKLRAQEVDAQLEPVRALATDSGFWRNMSEGLAIFAGPDHLSTYRLPVSFDEMVAVRRHFHIKPLLSLLSGDGRFYLLALSQEQVRLLEGTRDSVHKIDLEGVPESLAEALRYDDPQKMLRAAATGGGPVFHGGGGDDTSAKQDILRYFQMIDKGLRDLIADKHIPLVVAGVDYLLPLYRDANTYRYLMEKGLTGNPESLSAKELHAKAWQIVKPHFAKAQAEAKEQYNEYAGRDDDERASNKVVTVVRAAVEGRVASLFVANGVHKWGVYRSHSHKVHAHPQRQPGDQDLLDVAAVQTFLGGGTVYVVNPDEVPGGDVLAAVFRY